MRAGVRQSAAWLHTWSGLIVGWMLFVIFASGTAAYFQEEITRWMQPEVTAERPPVVAARNAVAFLEARAPGARTWFVTLPGERALTTKVFWVPAEGRGRRGETSAVLDGDGREVTARATNGGFFLYRFHFDLHYLPVILARYFVGICAMTMLVAVVTGVITHKKVFADFFTLRLGKGQRSWLDAHNVSAVLALPFIAMITYTGLVTLSTQYMPFGILARYQKPATFAEEALGRDPPPRRAGRPAAMAPLAPMFAFAERGWGGRVGQVTIDNPGDASARVRLARASSDRISSRGAPMVFDGVSGRPAASRREAGPAARTAGVMIGLHAGRYAGPVLRWLYFLSGLAGTAMTATGLILWTVKRRQKFAPGHPGLAIADRLNIAVLAGFPTGLAAYFLANRLLPLGMADRAAWEVNSLFIAWAGVAVWTLARPLRRAWIETLGAAALLFAAVPLVNAAVTPRNLAASLLHADWVFVGFDGLMLVLAAVFGWAARACAARRPEPVLRRRGATA